MSSFAQDDKWELPLTDHWYETERIMFELQSDILETRSLLREKMMKINDDTFKQKQLDQLKMQINDLKEQVILKDVEYSQEHSRVQEEIKNKYEKILNSKDQQIKEKKKKVSDMRFEFEELKKTTKCLTEELEYLRIQNSFLLTKNILLWQNQIFWECNQQDVADHVETEEDFFLDIQEPTYLKVDCIKGIGNSSRENQGAKGNESWESEAPLHKGVFCGYVTTQEERLRLKSADPEHEIPD